jgi:hypothetical protein
VIIEQQGDINEVVIDDSEANIGPGQQKTYANLSLQTTEHGTVDYLRVEAYSTTNSKNSFSGGLGYFAYIAISISLDDGPLTLLYHDNSSWYLTRSK